MNKIKAILQRITSTHFQTLGILTIYDEHDFQFWDCRTLELPWQNNQVIISCIPAGKYTVIKRWSEKYKDHFHITGVDGRSYILIHNANYKRQLKGCVAVGRNHTDIDGDGFRDVTSSVSTLKDMHKRLPKEFTLQILDVAA